MGGAQRLDMVGRDRELRLGSLLREHTARRPCLLVIGGDPGIGKTRLLGEYSERARRANWTVLAGSASALDEERPFGVFAEPVTQALRLVGESGTYSAQDRSLVSRHFWEPDADTEADRDALTRAITELLWTAARRHRLMLSLDDLHWADESSVRLVHGLLRSPQPGVPLLLACTLRPRQSSDLLTACLADARDAFRVERLSLGPLSRADADALLEGDTTAERRRMLYEAAEGVPFYLEVLARMPRPRAFDGSGTPLVLTDAAIALAAPVLARETAPLEAHELEVAQAAAVLGEEFDPAHLATLTDRDTQSLSCTLDTLAGRDLIRADLAHGRQFRFRHPLVRALVYQGAAPGWRQRAHGRAERLLRETGTSTVERAPHAARSASAGDFDAIRLLREASDQILDSEPGTASSWLRTALRLLREDSDPELRVRLMTSLARSLGASGQLRACRELLKEIPRALDTAPTRRDVELVAFQAMVERHLGNYRQAQALLEAELAMLPEHSAALGDPLRLELATVSLLRRAFPQSQAMTKEVLRHATGAQDRQTRMAATVRLAHSSAFAGDVPGLLDSAAEAASLVDAMADAELALHLDTLSQLGWTEALGERHHDALRHMTRGVRLALDSGQLFILPYMRLAHSYASVSVGRLADGLRSAEEAEEDAHRLERPALLGFALALRAWAVSLLDGPDAAAPIAERAVQEIGTGGRLWAVTAGVLADIRLAQQRPAECLELTRSAAEHSRHPGTARCIQPTWYALASRAAAAQGDHRQAATWALRATEDADLLALPGQHGYAALARAHSAADPVGPLREAISGFSSGGIALMECQARVLLARELVSGGENDEALTQANRAKSLAETSGARYLYRQAVDIQRQLGARLPRQVGQAALQLQDMSVREREIVRRVALGMSNGDIARALVVSPKTVEAHLTRIFRKVGVRSRVALVAALAHTGPEPEAVG